MLWIKNFTFKFCVFSLKFSKWQMVDLSMYIRWFPLLINRQGKKTLPVARIWYVAWTNRIAGKDPSVTAFNSSWSNKNKISTFGFLKIKIINEPNSRCKILSNVWVYSLNWCHSFHSIQLQILSLSRVKQPLP